MAVRLPQDRSCFLMCALYGYEKTKGAQAVKLYNLTGRKAQEWQELMLYDIMSVGEDGLWTHVKFGYSLPRRNGKSEILIMRELWGLVTGEHIPIKGTTQRTARRPRTLPGGRSWSAFLMQIIFG